MSGAEQMEYVLAYYKDYAGKLETIGDIYGYVESGSSR